MLWPDQVTCLDSTFIVFGGSFNHLRIETYHIQAWLAASFCCLKAASELLSESFRVRFVPMPLIFLNSFSSQPASMFQFLSLPCFMFTKGYYLVLFLYISSFLHVCQGVKKCQKHSNNRKWLHLSSSQFTVFQEVCKWDYSLAVFASLLLF